jgi:hypothetical protein
MSTETSDFQCFSQLSIKIFKVSSVLALILLGIIGFKVVFLKPAFAPTFENNMRQTGDNYRQFVLSASLHPEECMRICLNEDECQAWNYTKPGVNGPDGYCWLKHESKMGIYDEQSISGIARK